MRLCLLKDSLRYLHNNDSICIFLDFKCSNSNQELDKKGITKSDPRIAQIIREMEKKNPSSHLEAQFTYHEFSKY